MGFGERLFQAVKQCGNPALVGLDPRLNQLPESLSQNIESNDYAAAAEAYRRFCCDIIDVVAGLVPAVKPQAAFFEQLGPAGATALAQVVEYAIQHDLLVILDGKRNDIGSTATAYAEAYLGRTGPWKSDALTVSPYLGGDSLEPFVNCCQANDAGIFVLVKTSNPGGGHFQDIADSSGETIYQKVAGHVQSLAAETVDDCGFGAVGAVVGATYPEQLVELRAAMPQAWLLVPGFGAQGGSAESVAGAFRDDGMGAIINSSRGIIFAHARAEYAQFGQARWQDAVAAATRDMIAALQDVSGLAAGEGTG